MQAVQKRQIAFSPPDISDLEQREMIEALRSGWITTGPKTKRFEEEIAAYCGTPRAVCLNSGTACMELALRVLGVGPGDEVVTSAYTYTATAAVIHHVGARIVFVDVGRGSFELDYEALRNAITERTKVVIPVDIGGVMCDYDRVLDIVEQKRALFHPAGPMQEVFGRAVVLADAAHSFGARYGDRRSGAAADMTAFSFHAVKNLTTAEGGALTWREREGLDSGALYRALQLLSLHGQSKDALAKMKKGAWEYDILEPGYKCNMTDLMAGIGMAQLARFDGLLARRRALIRAYDERLLPLGLERLEHGDPARTGNGHLYLARVPGVTEEGRNAMIASMAEAGIACNVHFKPLPMMTAYRRLGFSIQNYPNAYAQYANELTLPLHTLLSDEDAAYVADTFADLLQTGGRGDP